MSKDGQYNADEQEVLDWMRTTDSIEKKPYKITCGPMVAVDVDDTLLMWDIPEGVIDEGDNDERFVTVRCRDFTERLFINKYNVDLLKKMATRGHSIMIWSGGGSDWAEAACEALGLNKYVEVVSGKPQYYIDDLANPKEWIGKHGYFDIDGNRIHGDNLPKEKK